VDERQRKPDREGREASGRWGGSNP
jgi:hypothetical protein